MSGKKPPKRSHAFDPMDGIHAARSTQPQPQQKKKREAVQTACTSCQRRKSKCDGAKPSCALCIQKGTTCDYPDDLRRTSHVRGQNTRLAGRNKQLEDLVERLRSASSDEVYRLLHEFEAFSTNTASFSKTEEDVSSQNRSLDSVRRGSTIDELDEMVQQTLAVTSVDGDLDASNPFGEPALYPYADGTAMGFVAPSSSDLHFVSPGGREGQMLSATFHRPLLGDLLSPSAVQRGFQLEPDPMIEAALMGDFIVLSGAQDLSPAQAVAISQLGSVDPVMIRVSQLMPLNCVEPTHNGIGEHNIPFGVLCSNFVKRARDDVICGRRVLSEMMGSPSVDGTMLIETTHEAKDPISQFVYHLTHGLFPDQVTKLAFMHVCHRLIQWMISPSDDTYERVPTIMRPVPQQLLIAHPAWIDPIMFPKLRSLLITRPELQTREEWATILSSCRVAWPGTIFDCFAPNESNSWPGPSLEFQEHIDSPERWILSSSVLQVAPEISTFCQLHQG